MIQPCEKNSAIIWYDYIGGFYVNFINEFIEVIEKRRGEFKPLLSGSKELNEIEVSLRNHLQIHWHNNISPRKNFEREFSVDSSSASRTLANGIDFFIIRALMIGSDRTEHKHLKFEMLKGIRDSTIASTFERILRDLIEVEIVVNNCEKLNDSLVMIDGNLYGRFTHLLKQLYLKGWESLPLRLFESMQNLFDICAEKNIILVGVSKFSKTRVFCSALLSELGIPITDPDYLDVELLYRWKQGEVGFTTPLLLGEYAFVDEVRAMHSEPESYRERYFGNIPRELQHWGTKIIQKVPLAPAIIMFHLIPSRFEQPLRVDIPANCLGLLDKIMDVSPYRFLEPEIVQPVVQQLVEDWGGTDVYNALLYVVDQEVRLGREVVDSVYRSVLGRELDAPIMYDRNTRRFYS
jgi:hypothetical protein